MLRLTLLLFVLCAPALAHAEPMFTPQKEVYAKTKTIVLARMKLSEQPKTFGAGNAVIHVEEVIHGKAKLGRLEVGACGGSAGVPQQQPFVAFLDDGGGMCFIAVPLPGGSVRTGILQMHGFYDFNAHLVGPAMASLPQIRATLAGKPHTFSFRGKIHVVDTKTGGLTPTSHEVTATCHYSIDTGCTKSEIEGLDWVGGVPEPGVGLSAWDPLLHITYRTGWPRPLALQGRIVGWDAKRKEHTVRLEVSMPDLLTKKHLETYLRDPDLAYGVWHYALTFEDGTTWKMTDGRDYTSGPRLVTDEGETHRYTQFSFNAESRELVFDGEDALTLTFEGHASAFDRAGTSRRFRHAAVVGGVTFEVTKGPRKGKKGKLTLERVEWKGPVTSP